MTQDTSIVVSVIVPLHNDGDILADFLRDLVETLGRHYTFFEIVLIDDGSDDNTRSTIDELLRRFDRVRYLALSRRFGREVAISAGLETAIGDFVAILIPATDPVELIPELIEKCRRGSGLLGGLSRRARHRNFLTARISRLFHAYCRRFLGFDYHENSTDFRVLSRQAVNAITRIRDRHRYLRVFTATLGYNQEFFTYDPLQRKPLTGGENLFDHFNTAIEIVIANSRHPLRIVSRIGLLMSFLNFLYMFYIVGIYLFKTSVAEGWTTASLQQTTMFFFVFLILAVLCEYVGRILEETQDRPLYFVAQEKNSSVLLESSIEKNIINQPRPPADEQP